MSEKRFGTQSDVIVVFKSTRAKGVPTHGSKKLPQPKGDGPGAWHDTGGLPILCERGVHGCRTALDLLRGGWLNEWLWVAELRGPFIEEPGGDKLAGRSGRLVRRLESWNDRTARLFAADCAERALRVANVTDERSWNAVRAARLFAFDRISAAAMAAARAAAWAATWDAARDAACDAARDAARAAAWDATWDAACDAARDAAWAAAWDAETKWQAQRLHDYLTEAVDLAAIESSLEDLK